MKLTHILAYLLMATAVLAQAVTYTWTATSDGNWADAANWTPAGYPNSPDDTVVFSNLAFSSTAPITITLPASPVTAGVIYIVTEVTNTFILSGGRLVLTNSATTNAFVRIPSTPSGIPSKTQSLVVMGALEILQDTVFDLYYFQQQGCFVYGPLHGAGTITKINNGSPYLEFTNALSTYSGTVIGNVNSVRSFYNALGNAKQIILRNASVYFRNLTTMPIIFYNGSSAGCDGTVISSNVWTVIASNRFGGYGTWRHYGDIVGTGTVYKSNNSAMEFLGAIKPGFSVGSLNFWQRDPGAHVFRFGTAVSPLKLYIEVAGSGGVPGVDFDSLSINVTNVLDLSYIDLHVSGIPTGTQTNWFLSVPGPVGFINPFASVQHANGHVTSIIYDGVQSRVGMIVIPEPSRLIGLGLAGIVVRRWHG